MEFARFVYSPTSQPKRSYLGLMVRVLWILLQDTQLKRISGQRPQQRLKVFCSLLSETIED